MSRVAATLVPRVSSETGKRTHFRFQGSFSPSDRIWQLVCISLAGDLMVLSLSLAPRR